MTLVKPNPDWCKQDSALIGQSRPEFDGKTQIRSIFFFYSKNQFWTVQVEHESDWSQQDSSLIGTGRALSNVTSFGWVVWVDPNMTGLKDQRYS